MLSWLLYFIFENLAPTENIVMKSDVERKVYLTVLNRSCYDSETLGRLFSTG